MISMLIAYDANGNVVGTLSHVVARDDEGNIVGLVDFDAHESAGGKMRDIWEVSNAVGSGTWPEWIGARAHDFKVEVDPDTKKITSLVHKKTGKKRTLVDIHKRIQDRIASTEQGKAADLRDILGGPTQPLLIDDNGNPDKVVLNGTPKHIPVIKRGVGNPIEEKVKS